MSASFHLEAPAKLNLGLRILGVRGDGYHELESLFVALDFGDAVALQVEAAETPQVEFQLGGDDVGAPDDERNLALRAARAFLERAAISVHVRVGLTKHTPAAAGLGGASSDAAAVLRGLARALPDALDPPTLRELALSLGADVPYFLDPRPAWVSGIGERRETIDDLPPLALLLANPGQALATAEVYRVFDALERPPAPPRGRPDDLRQQLLDGHSLDALLHNDLEPAALRLCPAIARWRAALEASGARAVGLSGSGATLFAIFPDRAAAEAARAAWSGPAGGWLRVASLRESG